MSDQLQIRFGLQVNPAVEEVADVARLAEEAGLFSELDPGQTRGRKAAHLVDRTLQIVEVTAVGV